jgi:predicted transcriptional regulator of viral defense system
MNARLEGEFASAPAAELSIPDGVGTPQSKLCYLALDAGGAATLEELDAALELGKLTLLDVLGTLADAGHVERTDDGRYLAN